MMINGTRHGKFFADSRNGGKARALSAARGYRDSLVERRPNRIDTAKPRPLLVTRGATQCFQIRVPKAGGGTSTTEFSVGRHGMRKARKMAIDAFNAAKESAGR